MPDFKASLTQNGVALALTTHAHSGIYQPLDADLTALSSIASTVGLVKRTGAGSFTIDTSAYLTSVAWSSLTGSPAFGVFTNTGNGTYNGTFATATAGRLYFGVAGATKATLYWDATGLNFYSDVAACNTIIVNHATGTVDFPQGIVGEAWRSDGLQTGWSNYTGTTYNPFGFWKDAMGVVHVRGMMTRDATNTAQTVIAHLPAGYIPHKRELHACMSSTGAAIRVDIDTDNASWCNIVVMGTLAAGGWVSLDGISFRTT
jgi:hypothetical protein